MAKKLTAKEILDKAGLSRTHWGRRILDVVPI